MKKKSLALTIILLALLLIISTSCSQVRELSGTSTQQSVPEATPGGTEEQKSLSKENTAGDDASSSQTAPEPDKSSEGKSKGDRLIIRQKYLSMEIKDVRKTYSAVDRIAAKYKGQIVSASISSDETGPYYGQDYPSPEESITPAPQYSPPTASSNDGPKYATIVLKVPGERAAVALKDIKKLGKIESEQESEEEVTDQYIDLNARLTNLKRTEQRYLDFFNAAKTVEDMLKIEEQLSRVRGEIESLQAQIDHLEKSARMATITLNLHEPAQVTTPISDWGFIKALQQAVQNFVTVVNYLVMALGALLPLIILLALLILAIRIIIKRRMKRS
jgi:hypothetical protein